MNYMKFSPPGTEQTFNVFDEHENYLEKTAVHVL